ncbi:MAG: efflux RND transporter permease subunit [Lactobacillaceae bacterium]|jgi:hydrophobe/amphiphile efflux-1 (HAE1) family protein|nr:efflux RND transporter permease subunit [Lactobacillaceae bacterium]
MFSKFFIDRPRFAMVIALVMTLAGTLALFSMPIALYPPITPPDVVVSANYPGASAEVISKTVAIPIEEAVNGVENMLYMSSTSNNSGNYSLTVTFAVGTDPDLAQVKVQNRVQQAMPLLPQEVQRQGVNVKRRSSDTLGFLAATSPNGTHDALFMTNFIQNNIKNEISRVPGVGEVQVFASKLSMRVWLDADKITSLNMSVNEIISAISSQNYQPSLGKVGGMPDDSRQTMVYTLQTQGRLNEVEDFKNIIVRTNENGGLLRLKDVAKVEVGQESYTSNSRYDGKTSVAMAVNLLSGANALDTMEGVKKAIERLRSIFPEDFDLFIGYDSTKYIKASIEEVAFTILLTGLLVVAVCYVFLQDWRATLIPAIAIPVSLVTTFAVLTAMGYTLNILTLFALVLAIAVVVDDAILVVERVLHLMEAEKITAKEASYKAMEQISSAIIATTAVLLAIFVPVGFLGGITGKIYQQFAVTISAALIFSAINALTLSPALCATILKPFKARTSGPLHWFNNFVTSTRDRYIALISIFARKISVIALVLVLLVISVVLLLRITQTSFIPDEDQGAVFVDIRLPEGATRSRTNALTEQISSIAEEEAGVDHVMFINGFSMLGGASDNSAMGVFILKDWGERSDAALHSTNIRNKISQKISSIPNAAINLFEPPAIPGMGMTSGLSIQLQSTETSDPQKLDAALQSYLGQINALPEIMYAFTSYTSQTPNIYITVDREKAELMGIPVSDVFGVFQNYLGSTYINDVNFGTQVNKVVIQSDFEFRKNISSIEDLYAISSSGKAVPLGSLVETKKILAPRNITRYNQYPSAAVTAMTMAGVPSGTAMSKIAGLAKALPKGFTYSWSGITYQEADTEGEVSYLIMLALIFGYLFLVAQYESWTIPIPVLSSVTVAMIGALLGLFLYRISLSIYAQLGLILLVGLAAKNAILIVEFAKDDKEQNKTTTLKAAMNGTKERYRALWMTALTFVLGVIPLITATGANAESRRAIGVTTVYGMALATVLGVLIIPMLYVLFETIRERVSGEKTVDSKK